MKIIAIGGGDNGRVKILPDGTKKQYPLDNIPINKKIIEMTGKSNPNILFLGTAGKDSPNYTDYLMAHFSSLGANVSELRLVENPPTEPEIRNILSNTDAVYVGGGDTRFMIDCWQKIGFDKLLQEYADAGMILSGLSAGAICWFDYYDNEDYIQNETGQIDWNKLDLLPGLGFIHGFCVPHYNTKTKIEQGFFDALAKKHNIPGWAIDNNAAIIFDNGKITTVASQPNMSVHYLNTQPGQF